VTSREEAQKQRAEAREARRARSASARGGDEEKREATPDRQDGHGSAGKHVSRVRDAARRSEPLVSAGWEAARDSVTPLVEMGARAAGSFLGERSPDLVRESVVPQFIEGFNKGRRKSGP
jgi:hypothetical protein